MINVDGEAAGSLPRSVHFVLPAFRESASLRVLVEGITGAMGDARIPYSIHVVDDGSDDGTVESLGDLLVDPRVNVLRNERNEGLGYSVRRGLLAALERARPSDVVVTMDADLTQEPLLVVDMLARHDAGADVVIASRFRAGAHECGVPIARRLLSRCARVVIGALMPVRGVSDYTSGFRSYSVSALRHLRDVRGDALFTETGFAYVTELLGYLAPFVVIDEVPLVLRYDLKRGSSAMRLLATIRGHLRAIRSVRRMRDRGTSRVRTMR